jgi:hypothetical protein
MFEIALVSSESTESRFSPLAASSYSSMSTAFGRLYNIFTPYYYVILCSKSICVFYLRPKVFYLRPISLTSFSDVPRNISS